MASATSIAPTTDPSSGADTGPTSASADGAESSTGGDPPLDLECFEAEDFSSQEIFGDHQWQVESRIGGYSGVGYVVTRPEREGFFCEPPTTPDCGAIVHYEIEIEVAGDYNLFLHTYSENTASDSLWWGYDGEFPTSLDVSEDSQWGWHPSSASAVRTLTAGPHTLDLWMRENGLRVDKISITMAPGPP